jgi:hypothetical protein
MSGATRIAMWSGPRNISTAMMRAWENRRDCAVVDEPFYAHYLEATGIDHPGREEVIASQETDWRKVAERLLGPVPGNAPIFYQKHMAHHFLPGMEGEWLNGLTHAFLIRDPEEMVASYARSREQVAPADLGLHRQVEIRELVCAGPGPEPPVLDSRDVLENPDGVLRALCGVLSVPFDSAMLSWPAGPRDTDGVWAPYWYAAVEKSTGFLPYRPKALELNAEQQAVADACREPYEFLRARRLRV